MALGRLHFDEEGEVRFREYYDDEVARFCRWVLPFGTTCFLAFGIWEWMLDPMNFWAAFRIRIVATAILILVCAWTYSTRLTRWRSVVLTVGLLNAYVSVILVISSVDRGIELGVPGILLATIISVGGFRAALPWVIGVSVGVMGFFNVMLDVRGVDDTAVASHNMMVGTGLGFALFFHWVWEGHSRRTFDLEHRLVQEKEQTEQLLREVSEARESRLRWLESLAGFLRHELKNQIIGTRSSLDLLERREDVAPDNAYLERARRSVDVMQRLLQAASEATSIESAVVDEEWEDLELSATVRAQLETFEELLAERTVVVEAAGPLMIRGNGVRLHQMLDKLVSNALEHSGAGQRVAVSVFRRDGQAIVQVDNEGDALPADRAQLFEPFFTTGAGGGSGNLGIGLYVAALIAHSHGGDIEALDRPGGGARFECHFPLLGPPAPETD